MSSAGWWIRSLLVGICLVCVPVVGGCRKDAATKESVPISKLSADDLRAVVQSLGYEAVAATTSKSGEHANITVIGFREHPEGDEGADGKKRLRLMVSLHEDPEGSANRAASLDKLGAAYRIEGRHTLSVELSNGDRKECKRILDKLAR